MAIGIPRRFRDFLELRGERIESGIGELRPEAPLEFRLLESGRRHSFARNGRLAWFQCVRHCSTKRAKPIRRGGCPTSATSALRPFSGDFLSLLAPLGEGDRNGLLAALDLAALAAAPALGLAAFVAMHLVLDLAAG